MNKNTFADMHNCHNAKYEKHSIRQLALSPIRTRRTIQKDLVMNLINSHVFLTDS
jgi:hypothetical protein